MRCFLHSTQTIRDTRIRKVIRTHGADGYASYLMLLEAIASSDCRQIDLSDIGVAQLYARDFGLTNTHKLLSIVDTCVEVGLFNRLRWEVRIVYSDDLRIVDDRQDRVYQLYKDLVFQRDGYICAYCGSTEKLTLDHVMPKSRGGSHEPDNLVCCCQRCNCRKGTRTPDEWRRSL